METFLEYETMCREPAPGHVLVGSLAKSIQGKRQKWCVVYVTKNNASATHFPALSETHIAISLETCKA